MKKFSVIGIKRREFRGNFQPMTMVDEVEAKDKQEAGKLFEKANPQYVAKGIDELPPERDKKTGKIIEE